MATAAVGDICGGCKRCGKQLGRFFNLWDQVTGSYYLESRKIDAERPSITAKGAAKPASATHEELQGCLLQPLACDQCGEGVAFRCLEAPEGKASYKSRDFFKLAKLKFAADSNDIDGTAVEPILGSSLVQQRPTVSVSPTLQVKSSPLLQQDEKPASPQVAPSVADTILRDADKAAIRGTNDGSLLWQEAHENWARETGRELSPMSFARRIITNGGGELVKLAAKILPLPQSVPQEQSPLQAQSTQQQSAVQQNSPAMAPQPRPRSTQEAHKPQKLPQPYRPDHRSMQPITVYTNSFGVQPADRSRVWVTGLRGAPGRWVDQGDPAAAKVSSPLTRTSFSPKGLPAGPHWQVQPNHPQQLPRHPQQHQTQPPQQHGPQSQQQAASPVSMQQSSMQFQLDHQHQLIGKLQKDFEQMRMSLWNLEGAMQALRESMSTSQSSQRGLRNEDEALASARDDAMDVLSETVSDITGKTGKVDGMVLQLDTLKRKVTRLEQQYGSSTPQRPGSLVTSPAMSHSQPSTQGVKRGAALDDHEFASKRVATTEAVRSMAESRLQGGDGLSTPRSIAPATQGFTAVNSNTPTAGYPPEGGWEYQKPTTGFVGNHKPSEGPRGARGRPRKSFEIGYQRSPQEQMNGDWNSSPGQVDADGYFNDMKKGANSDRGRIIRRGRGGAGPRAKPVRNADGLLVRPNGTIDRRSITSRQNLAKYQKKLESGELTSYKSSPAGSPGPTGHAGYPNLHGRPLNGLAQKAAATTTERPTEHSKIMSKMFPNGVASDAERMNPAAHLFTTSSPRRAKLFSRHEMHKGDAAEDAAQSKQISGPPVANNDTDTAGKEQVASPLERIESSALGSTNEASGVNDASEPNGVNEASKVNGVGEGSEVSTAAKDAGGQEQLPVSSESSHLTSSTAADTTKKRDVGDLHQVPLGLEGKDGNQKASRKDTSATTETKDSTMTDNDPQAPSPGAFIPDVEMACVPDSEDQSRRPSLNAPALPNPASSAEVVKDSQQSYRPSQSQMETQSDWAGFL